VPDFTVSYRTDRPPAEAFDALVVELEDGLARSGIVIEPRPGGAIRLGDSPLGVITVWNVGKEIGIRWRAMPWGRSTEGTIQARVEAESTGSRISWSLSGWAGLFDTAPEALPEWLAGDLLPTVVRRLLPQAVGDWFTDRAARRPGGLRARENYQDPTFHWPNFWLILDRLALRSEDRLLEVGCGGGAFLHQALESGCSATGIDHSLQMVRLAQKVNADEIRSGRLTVLEGDAGRLPVGSGEYTCCVSTGAIGFFPDPLAALREMLRALVPGGRLVVYAGTSALRGTPAAPEPVASRVRFFEGPSSPNSPVRRGSRRSGWKSRTWNRMPERRDCRRRQCPSSAGPGGPCCCSRRDRTPPRLPRRRKFGTHP